MPSEDTIMEPVFNSLLETDLYKFTMWQAMLHHCADNHAEYTFVCRNQPAVDLAYLADAVNEQLDHLCSLRFTADELSYLGGLRYIKPDFVDFLREFRFSRGLIQVSTEGTELRIVASGPQIHVMAFEVYVLAIVNELHFRSCGGARTEGRARLGAKISKVREHVASRRFPFQFFDFGLRRRFSGAWHREVVETLARELPEYFGGTSNVLLAKELGLTPIGTMAHEWLQTFQAMEGIPLEDSQGAALAHWLMEYGTDLGIALTDVVGMDAFLRDFGPEFTMHFSGLRHDSGDPVEWGEKALAHYEKMLHTTKHNKRLVFSDGLDIDKALALHAHFADRVRVGFGIGTNLTNDTGYKPLNVVMKLTQCNGKPVAKLSDSPGKTLCKDEAFLARLREAFEK
jgi:nicotinate phosphoribosyltransferase